MHNLYVISCNPHLISNGMNNYSRKIQTTKINSRQSRKSEYIHNRVVNWQTHRKSYSLKRHEVQMILARNSSKLGEGTDNFALLKLFPTMEEVESVTMHVIQSCCCSLYPFSPTQSRAIMICNSLPQGFWSSLHFCKKLHWRN